MLFLYVKYDINVTARITLYMIKKLINSCQTEHQIRDGHLL